MLYIRLRRKTKISSYKCWREKRKSKRYREWSSRAVYNLPAECGLGRVEWAESDLVTRGCYMASLADSTTLNTRGILHFALAWSLSSKVNTNPAVNCRGYTGTVFISYEYRFRAISMHFTLASRVSFKGPFRHPADRVRLTIATKNSLHPWALKCKGVWPTPRALSVSE